MDWIWICSRTACLQATNQALWVGKQRYQGPCKKGKPHTAKDLGFFSVSLFSRPRSWFPPLRNVMATSALPPKPMTLAWYSRSVSVSSLLTHVTAGFWTTSLTSLETKTPPGLTQQIKSHILRDRCVARDFTSLAFPSTGLCLLLSLQDLQRQMWIAIKLMMELLLNILRGYGDPENHQRTVVLLDRDLLGIFTFDVRRALRKASNAALQQGKIANNWQEGFLSPWDLQLVVTKFGDQSDLARSLCCLRHFLQLKDMRRILRNVDAATWFLTLFHSRSKSLPGNNVLLGEVSRHINARQLSSFPLPFPIFPFPAPFFPFTFSSFGLERP